MSVVWRRLRRVHKRASKFRFVVDCRELIFDCVPKWRPEQILISMLHRRRRCATKPRRVDWSFENPNRAIVVWPEVSSDPINMTTTLFRDMQNDQFEDKEWTVVVEELTAKGKVRPLAAVPVNVRLFVNDLPGTRMEAKFKLRPLRKEIRQCTIQLDLSDDDMQSVASSASQALSEKNVCSTEPGNNRVDVYVKDEQTEDVVDLITKISDDIQKMTDSARRDDDRKNIEPLRGKTQIEPPVKENTRESIAGFQKPEKIPGEPLLDWCQRIVKDSGVQVKDFTKSFKNGRAFCVLIHRYRPDLIPEINQLYKAESAAAYKYNLNKAFDAAHKLGIKKVLDESVVVTLPDRHQIQKFLIELRARLEGTPDLNGHIAFSPVSMESDHRISTMFEFSQGEFNAMEGLEKLKSSRLEKPEEQHSEPNGSQQVASVDRPLASDTYDEPDTNMTEVRDLAEFKTGTLDKKDQLRQKARKLLENPATAVTEARGDETEDQERRQRLQAEARRLLQGDMSLTPQPLGTPGPLRRSASVRSTTSLTSDLELRTLGVVQTQTNFRSFKKVQPSPVLSRKQYDNPILPAFGRGTERTTSETPPPLNSAIDRMKRIGSLRTHDLAESINQLISKEFDRKPGPAIPENQSTPTRKITSRAEQDLNTNVDPSMELLEISDRMSQIEKLQIEMLNKRQHVEPGSEEEAKLVAAQVQLTNEKDELVRRQDYLNVLADLNETREKSAEVKKNLADLTERYQDGIARTEDEKTTMDELMMSLKELVDRESDLSQQLHHIEEEEVEERERGRATLERSRNFNRGTPQEPLSASRRLINMFRS